MDQQLAQPSTETTITVHTFDGNKTAALAHINNAELQPSTKRKYRDALTGYLATGYSLTDGHALAMYARQLPSETAKRHLQAAVSKWTAATRQTLRNNVTPDNLASVQATMYRLDGLDGAIKVKTTKGEKVHIWLTAVEQSHLLELVDTSTLKGQRDNVLLRLLLGVGLRRSEAAALEFDNIKTMGHMPVIETEGKGRKNRIVPIGANLAALLEQWREVVGNGFILRSISQGGKVGESLSDVSVFRVVAGYGREMRKAALTPHDLRRTFAENLRRNGVDVVTISTLLGHESIETTKRYLNVNVDLSVVGADYLPW